MRCQKGKSLGNPDQVENPIASCRKFRLFLRFNQVDFPFIRSVPLDPLPKPCSSPGCVRPAGGSHPGSGHRRCGPGLLPDHLLGNTGGRGAGGGGKKKKGDLCGRFFVFNFSTCVRAISPRSLHWKRSEKVDQLFIFGQSSDPCWFPLVAKAQQNLRTGSGFPLVPLHQLENERAPVVSCLSLTRGLGCLEKNLRKRHINT